MKLRELEHVIEENASVSIFIDGEKSLPICYPTWTDCKKALTKEAWDFNVTLNSNAGILITFYLKEKK